MLTKSAFRAAAAIGLAVVAIALGWAWWLATPQHSMNRLAEAVRNHDIETVATYADIESLAGDVKNAVATRALVGSTETTRTAMGSLAINPFATAHTFAPFIRQYIETTESVRDRWRTLYLLDGGSYEGLRNVSIQGAVATGDLIISYPSSSGAREERAIKATMRKRGSRWQLFSADFVSAEEGLMKVHAPELRADFDAEAARLERNDEAPAASASAATENVTTSTSQRQTTETSAQPSSSFSAEIQKAQMAAQSPVSPPRPPLAAQVYIDSASRTYFSEDCQRPPRSVRTAKAVALSQGYRPSPDCYAAK